MSNRQLFVGSSQEASNAGALTQLIDELTRRLPATVEVISWVNTDWQNLKSALSSLEQSLTRYSYAVFLAWPDDKLETRGTTFYCCRDNVIFEFGLFLSQLGTNRTFLVAPQLHARLPPDDLEYHILTDILGTFLAGQYTLAGPPPTASFQLDNLIHAITRLEREITTLTPHMAQGELSREIQKGESAVGKVGYPDAYYSGYLRNTVDRLVTLRAVEARKSIQDAANDMLLFIRDEGDLCNVKQLASLQRHNVEDLGRVWVLGDSPLEFQAIGGMFDELRHTIRENLLHGVQYKYVMTEDGFRGVRVDTIVSPGLSAAEQSRMKGNLSFVLVDKKFFKTYFTLHFTRTQPSIPSRVYMSLLREDRRRDLLIQVEDTTHIKRIRETIELLCGSDDDATGVSVRRFV